MPLEITKIVTKSSVACAADAYVNNVLESGDVGTAWAESKWMQEVASAIQERLETHILERPPLDTYRTHGILIEVTKRTDYDFAHDAKWKSAKASENEGAKVRKEREIFLKALPEPLADPETGELIEPARVKAMKSIIRTTLQA